METKANRSVLVVYEDEDTRGTAVRFCDQLVELFWSQCGFDVNWCSFSSLKDPRQATKTGERAACADLIVFSATPEGSLPAEVRTWIDHWAQTREDREGAVIGLHDPARHGGGHASKYTWVRQAAHRAGLDYLMQVPHEIAGISGSFDTFKDRAFRVTAVLDEILHRPSTHAAHTAL